VVGRRWWWKRKRPNVEYKTVEMDDEMMEH
jgi:hypothetical protein